MPTLSNEPDPVQRATRRRLALTLVLAVAFPTALILLGTTSHPELGFVLIAVVIPVLIAFGYLRNRRTREGSDERAQESHRRAASLAWYAVTFALVAMAAWTDFRQGISAAEPYLALIGVSIGAYYVAVLTRQWRGL